MMGAARFAVVFAALCFTSTADAQELSGTHRSRSWSVLPRAASPT